MSWQVNGDLLGAPRPSPKGALTAASGQDNAHQMPAISWGAFGSFEASTLEQEGATAVSMAYRLLVNFEDMGRGTMRSGSATKVVATPVPKFYRIL